MKLIKSTHTHTKHTQKVWIVADFFTIDTNEKNCFATRKMQQILSMAELCIAQDFFFLFEFNLRFLLFYTLVVTHIYWVVLYCV